MNNIAKLLNDLPVFAALEPEERKLLASLAKQREYKRDQFVILAGEVWPCLLLVKQGVVQAYKESSDGRSLMVAEFKKGELFWGAAFFSDQAPMPVTLITSQPSSILLWRRDDILPVLVRHGQACWEFCCLMAERMQNVSMIVEDLAFRTVAGRVARLLLEQAQDQDITPRSLTLDEMATRTGTTREMVCRSMQRFAGYGLIKITRTEFFISNREGLEKMIEMGKGLEKQ